LIVKKIDETNYFYLLLQWKGYFVSGVVALVNVLRPSWSLFPNYKKGNGLVVKNMGGLELWNEWLIIANKTMCFGDKEFGSAKMWHCLISIQNCKNNVDRTFLRATSIINISVMYTCMLLFYLLSQSFG